VRLIAVRVDIQTGEPYRWSLMLDHIFLTVSDIDRSIAFYTKVLASLGITNRLDYEGRDGPPGHSDLKGFGAKGRMFFWLRSGTPAPGAVHVGFVADSEQMVNAAHAAASAAGAGEIHPPGPQLHYDPRYYAAQVTDPDGYSLEFVYKSWQH
jgi:catechol 2,3-dioxygenase-like lactoylglutathione lyase family enzyme